VTEHPGSFITGLIFAAMGVIFLGETMEWWSVDIGRLWPVVLIAIGVSIMLKAYRRDRQDSDS
jgi:drug/metabolite transporter (DMT)-like permease